MEQTEMLGARNEKVPPWTISRRFPHVVCRIVVKPETKNIVAMSAARSAGFSMPRGSERISGIAIVEPNIVR